MLSHRWDPGSNTARSQCVVLFMYYWIWFANILLRVLCIYIHQRYWPLIFCFGSVFVWFWYQGGDGFKE